MSRYIARHWRGELGPAVSWWVNSVAVTALLWYLVPRLAVAAGVAPPDSAGAFWVLLVVQALQFGVIPLWQLVGLWRCGSRRLRAPGGWRAGRAVQVAAFYFTTFIAMRGLLAGSEQLIGSRLALAFGPYSYTVELMPGGREIAVSGGLGFGVADDVRGLLAEHPRVRRIRLDSGGGALSEGTKLRDIIVEHGLDTYSGLGCSSACVSAFAGGRFRYLKRGAPMGVHLPRNWDAFSRSPVAANYQRELLWLKARGLPDWFLARWIRSGQAFWYPTEAELLRSGLVTTFLGPRP